MGLVLLSNVAIITELVNQTRFRKIFISSIYFHPGFPCDSIRFRFCLYLFEHFSGRFSFRLLIFIRVFHTIQLYLDPIYIYSNTFQEDFYFIY